MFAGLRREAALRLRIGGLYAGGFVRRSRVFAGNVGARRGCFGGDGRGVAMYRYVVVANAAGGSTPPPPCPSRPGRNRPCVCTRV